MWPFDALAECASFAFVLNRLSGDFRAAVVTFNCNLIKKSLGNCSSPYVYAFMHYGPVDAIDNMQMKVKTKKSKTLGQKL